jgi:hypothetical protein
VIRPASSVDQPQIGTGNAEEPARPVNLIIHDGEAVAVPAGAVPAAAGPPAARQ